MMMRRQVERILFHVAVTSAILSIPAFAGGTYLPHHYFSYSPLIKRQGSHSPLVKRQGSHSLSRSRHSRKIDSTDELTATLMVSSRQRASVNSRSQEQDEERGDLSLQSREVSFNELGPIGKTIAGCTEIVFTTIFDYCSGYLQGLVIGTLVGSPGFLFRTSTPGVRRPFMDELSSRFARMNARSLKWGKTIGGISAAFGGFGVAVKVLRNGEQDVWSDICSSAAAGAFFARKDGPQAMLRGALLYGGLIYLTSGSRKNQIQEFTEKPASEF